MIMMNSMREINERMPNNRNDYNLTITNKYCVVICDSCPIASMGEGSIASAI